MADDEDNTKVALPLARVRKIIKSDAEVKSVSANGTVMIAKAAELFIGYLAKESYENTQKTKRRVLKYEDVATTVSESDLLEFLRESIPEQQEEEKPKKKKASKKN